jgi:predicted kinase
MGFYVIVRGPLGVGKTRVSRELARRLPGEYISIDEILDDHHLWVEGRLSEFLAANLIAARRAAPVLATGTPVVFDGNFYWKGQIDDLVGRLDHDPYTVTLDAPLDVCVARDARRDPPHGAEAARAVYRKSTAFEYGTVVRADRPVRAVVRSILDLLPTTLPPAAGAARRGPRDPRRRVTTR